MKQLLFKILTISIILSIGISSYADDKIAILYNKLLSQSYDRLTPELAEEINKLDAESKKALIAELFKGLKKNSDTEQRTEGMHESLAIAILKIDPSNQEARRVLVEGLRKCKFCTYNMTKLGSLIIPVFEEVIENKEGYNFCHQEVYRAIREMGASAEPFIPVLARKLLEEKLSDEERVEVAIVLERIGQASIPTLIQALNSENAKAREVAVSAIGWMGPKAKTAMPALLKTINDEDYGVRYSAYSALVSVGGDDPSVRAALVQAERKWFWRMFYTKEFFKLFDITNEGTEHSVIQRRIDQLDGLPPYNKNYKVRAR